jgi:hypothetical protein
MPEGYLTRWDDAMIESRYQYRVVCDVPDCGKSSGLHHSQDAITRQCENEGWEIMHCTVYGAVLLLARCPKCVKAGKVPEGWPS